MGDSKRLMSLDALRGFDMFFITGGAGMIAWLCTALGAGDSWLAQQMQHVPWAGLAHHDTIFPLFLFLAGVSWPFSLAAQEAKGRTPWQIHRKVIVRALILFTFGMIMGGLLKFKLPFRIPSVLGQIGLAWGGAAIICYHVRKTLPRLAIIAAILVGYTLFMSFTGAPGAPVGADLYSKEWNVISWFDRTLMPNYIYVKGVYDPESLFSAVSAIALAMLGVTAGTILREERLSGNRRALVLLGLSLVSLVLALLFIYVFNVPIVKALWSSSFILAAAAYSFAMLALFYWIIDVKDFRGWSFYFRVIGMNSITVYLLMNMGVIGVLNRYLFCGTVDLFPADWARFANNTCYQLTCWLTLWMLYRHKVFLKV